jgi:hypothetical protein
MLCVSVGGAFQQTAADIRPTDFGERVERALIMDDYHIKFVYFNVFPPKK